MPIETQSGIPCKFVAGDTQIFTEESSDFPPADWAGTAVLSRDGIKILQKAAAVEDGKWKVTLASAETSGIAPGFVDYVFQATKDGERTTIKARGVQILPNLSVDRPRTTAEKLLALCNTALESLAGDPDKMVDFNGQKYESKDSAELVTLRNELRAEVDAERARNGGRPNYTTIKSRLSR